MYAAPLATLIALLLATLLLASLRRVPEGQVHTVHRFGHFVRALPPGLHLVLPFVDRIAHQVCLIGHHVELPARPLGRTSASADLYYQILDPLRTGDALDSVDEVVMRQADAVLAEVAPQAENGWAVAADALKAELNRRMGGMGLRIIRCSLHPGA